MKVLAIDTALDACQAAVLDGERVLAVRSEPMERGHQERLAPMVQAAMADAGLAFADLDRLGVTVGPGSFTGLRVGLAFAKGVSLALKIPCLGVGTLEALGTSAGAGPAAAVIDARRERVYLQLYLDARPCSEPELLDIDEARSTLQAFFKGERLQLLGPGASLLDSLGRNTDALQAPDPIIIARLAALSPAAVGRPAPLYLRPPDAKTSAERAAAGSA